MTSYQWPSEDGWPYPDVEGHELESDDSLDDDALVLRAAPPHLFDQLDPLERKVVFTHYGLDGSPPRSMKQLHTDLGMTRAQVRETLASALGKLRDRLVE